MKTTNLERDLEFIKKVERISGENVSKCYQCGKCSAGCPAAYAMDILPDKIIRYVQLGMKDDAINSGTPWLCASCEQCATRCPQGVALSRVMEAVRAIAIEEQRNKAPEKNVRLFYKLYTDNLKMFGRIFEPMMMGLYNMRSFQPTKDMKNAVVLLRRGKLAFKPSTSGNVAEVRKIFERVNSEEK